MPAQKKVWTFDGSIEQYPSALDALGQAHGGRDCTGCHGGVDGTADRTVAHAGMQPIPGFDTCYGCHQVIAMGAAGSLHATGSGYQPILGARGVSFVANTASAQRFDRQCTKCHVANSADHVACGHCHVSVPNTAGGGLLAGHRMSRTPSMDNNCTACHGSRVKDEYYGSNGALLARNAAAAGSGPWSTWTLQPDVHNQRGKDCTFCHGYSELHSAAASGLDRYGIGGTPRCKDCHDAVADGSLFHSPKHIETMECAVCHAQPLKNCFGCHTDESSAGAFYRINEGDPTRAARTASGQPLVAGDALMAFRIGRNPRPDRPEKYVVLRHVPVDRDVFAYSGDDRLDGLVPAMTAAPTWKYATPHNIVRKTPIQSCAACHGPDAASFWLTDPVQDARGWIPPAYVDDEAAANAALVVPVPIPIPAP